ncbi:MAG TPA: hypothetical protein VHR72_11775, partial [Gemmataceae bacterium]|nr:hypothetical protein [Gemmataceae bacterium]
MADLLPPHGGLKVPVDRSIPAGEVAAFTKECAALKKIAVSDADLSSLYRMGDGGLSPLTGPMDSATYNTVLDGEKIVVAGKPYAWSIPIAFPIGKGDAANLKVGETVALTNARNELVGSLKINDIFPWDKAKYIKGVYQTDRVDHPGGRMTMNDPREMLLGGEVRVLPQPKNPEYGKFVLSPKETRALFAQRGWQRVVAFQTRNALHRAHEFALVYGVEKVTRDSGQLVGGVLNPLIGETKGDDVDATSRMKTYMALIDNKALGEGDLDAETW